jgi:hypothetical protein
MVGMEYSTALPKVGTSWFSRRQRQRVLPGSTAPPASPTHFIWRQVVSRDIRKQIYTYLRSKNPRHVAFIALLFFIVIWWAISILMVDLFGPYGSVKGGQIGYLVDQLAKDYVRYHTMLKWRQEIRSKLHIPLVHSEQDGTFLEPRFWPFDLIINTRPNVAVVEMLLREKSRVQKLRDLIQSSAQANVDCLKGPTSHTQIPAIILQLERKSGQMNQLLPYWITSSELLEIESFGVYNKDISLVSSSIDIQECQSLLLGTENYAMSTDINVHCLASSLGGMQLSGSNLKQHRPLIEDVLKMIKAISNQSEENNNANKCAVKVGYAILSNKPTPDLELRKTSSIMSYVTSIYTALPPDHLASLCLPPLHDDMGISPYTEANLELSFQSIFVNRLATTISHARSNFSLNKTDTIWGAATFQCDFKTDGLKCCNEASVSVLDSVDVNNPDFLDIFMSEDKSASKSGQHLIFTVTDIFGPNTKQPMSVAPISVSISEQFTHSSTVSRSKQSIQDSFKDCQPGWWCNRCLQTPLYGSFSKCHPFCARCVADVICDGVIAKQNQVTVNVHAKELRFPALARELQQVQQRIPRIIHQTWFEDITLESYPQLYRLQNTWRASGWEYRFYTDDSARKYIQDNYPPRFVTIFDSIIPGAYKVWR